MPFWHGGLIKEIESRTDPYGHPYYWMVGEYENLSPTIPIVTTTFLLKIM